MTRISRRIGAIRESATLAVDAKAKALKAAGEPVIGFGAGEPDFATPPHIVQAAVEACGDPRNHRYSPAAGIPELRDAIAHKTKRDSGFDCSGARVLVTNGGKHAVYNAFQVLLDPGDEVLCPAPYWTTYPECIALPGGRARAGADDCRRGLQGDHRPARRSAHRAHEGAPLRLAEQPDRSRLRRRRGRGDRQVGGRARTVGRHRRDLRAPHLRRTPVQLDAGTRVRSSPTRA